MAKAAPAAAASSAATTVWMKFYLLLSSIYFTLCAYVNLNDPGPLPWVLGYGLGGSFLPLIMLLLDGTSGREHEHQLKLRLLDAVDIVPAVRLYGFIVLAFVSYFSIQLWRNEDVVSVWTAMTQEDGRNGCGLAILWLHLKFLQHHIIIGVVTTGGSSNSNIPSGSVSVSGNNTVICSTAIMISVVIGAGYVWYNYQWEMNSGPNSKDHCSGSFEQQGNSYEL